MGGLAEAAACWRVSAHQAATACVAGYDLREYEGKEDAGLGLWVPSLITFFFPRSRGTFYFILFF